MPFNIKQNMIRKENEDLSAIDTLEARIVTEHLFTNADRKQPDSRRIPVESNEKQMILSDRRIYTIVLKKKTMGFEK